MSRMRDGSLDRGAIWTNVETFNGKIFRGQADIVYGGFPCQDVSRAGYRRGITAARSGLWREFARIVGETKPRFVLVENVAGLNSNGGTGVVLRDLAVMGFDAEWGTWKACGFGTPHMRRRVFIVAYTRHAGRWDCMDSGKSNLYDREPTEKIRCQGWNLHASWGCLSRVARRTAEKAWPGEPSIDRVVNGVAHGSHRTRLCGNGVVPQQAYPFFKEIVEASEVGEK